MKNGLTVHERKVISAVQLQAGTPFSRIASSIGMKTVTFTRIARRLIDRGQIIYYPIINSRALGFRNEGVFVKVKAGSAAVRSQLLEFLEQHPQVSAIEEFLGDYDFLADVLIRNSLEGKRLTSELKKIGKSRLSSIEILPRKQRLLFQRTYLTESRTKRSALQTISSSKIVSADKLDYDILHQLQSSRDGSFTAVSRALGVPLSTVSFRVHSLIESGVLLGFCYAIRTYLGTERYRILLKLRGRKAHTKLRSFCEAETSVVLMIECSGEWNAEIKVESPSAAELQTLLLQLEAHLGESLLEQRILLQVRNRKLSYVPPAGT